MYKKPNIIRLKEEDYSRPSVGFSAEKYI